MNYGADRYCKLFVSGAADDEALSAAVNAALRESAERTAAGADAVPVLDITVHAQVRHLPLDDGQDDFTHWRHYLDIDTAQEDVSTVDTIKSVKCYEELFCIKTGSNGF